MVLFRIYRIDKSGTNVSVNLHRQPRAECRQQQISGSECKQTAKAAEAFAPVGGIGASGPYPFPFADTNGEAEFLHSLDAERYRIATRDAEVETAGAGIRKAESATALQFVHIPKHCGYRQALTVAMHEAGCYFAPCVAGQYSDRRAKHIAVRLIRQKEGFAAGQHRCISQGYRLIVSLADVVGQFRYRQCFHFYRSVTARRPVLDCDTPLEVVTVAR